MTVGNIILRDFTFIFFPLFVKEVHSEFLLKYRISLVFFIRQYALDCCGLPDLFAARREYAFFREVFCDEVAVFPSMNIL